MLRESLGSLEQRFSEAGPEAEYLIAFDPDDTPPSSWPARARFWQAPERYGYGGLHRYYNALAGQAQGDWLWLWNDDLFMETDAWNAFIGAARPVFLFPRHNGPMNCNAFPVWPAAWTRHLGHVSLSPWCDTWMQSLAEAAGVQEPVDVQVRHETPQDQTWREGRAVTPFPHYAQDGLAGQFGEDVQRLKELLGR
jgi:hypothetical protein